MTDPSPESALAEVREMIGKEKNNADYEFAADKAHDLIETHGAHFAALAAENRTLEQHLADAMNTIAEMDKEAERAEADNDRVSGEA